MHILNLSARVDLGVNNPAVEPGEYLLDDATAAHLLLLSGSGEMQSVNSDTSIKPVGFCDTLFMRAGGFGDLILLTPVLREHKRQFPDARIGVCCMPHYAPILAGLEYIDEIVPYPPTTAQVYEWERWVFFEKAVEGNPLAKELHITDLFARIAGLETPDIWDRKPDYCVKATEAIWGAEQHPRTQGVRRVCIQPKTSARNRNYPNGLMGDVMGEFAIRRGWETMLLGAVGDVNIQGKVPPNLKDLTGLSFRQSCAMIASSDVFVGADSALLHVAGALGVPAVGIFGAFPWKLRTAYCPMTFAFQGTPLGPQCPCFHHVNMARQDHFPPLCPTAAKGVCGVLETISPDRVVAKAMQIARTYDPALTPAL